MALRVGPYVLVNQLAAGVAGAVWFARSDGGSEVALKISGSAPTDEFRLLSELDHPGVPNILGCGTHGGQFWVATRWVDGEPLERGVPAMLDEEAFAASLAHTLLYLGACGVCHGDVHPGNILAARSGYPGRLLDFGLASDGEAPPAGRQGFIAPEVWAGGARTPASDVYGLGASLRDRGAARSAQVTRFVDGAIGSDVQGRIEAARELAGLRVRPACGPRRVFRAEEFGQILRRMDRVAGPMQAVLVRGAAGMGKSGLLARIILEAHARGWTVMSGQMNGAESALAWANALRPLLIAVDDADLSGRRLVEAVSGVERLGAAGVVVIAASTGAVKNWVWDELELNPLEDGLIGGIVRQVAGVDRIDDADLRRIGDLTAGNPRHAQELARSVVSSGGLERGAGGWQLRPNAPLAVPADAATAARPVIAELGIGETRVMAAAALAAGFISRAALLVAAAAGLDSLERLEVAGLVREEGAGVVPRDAALGAAAVERLSAEERAGLHRRLGALTGEAQAPRWVVAWNWIRANEAERGIREAVAASVEMGEVGDVEGARRLLAAALDLGGPASSEREKAEAMLVYFESMERADEGIARRAEAIALRAGEEKVKRSMGSVVISQWMRLRRPDELEAAAARLSGVLGDWIAERAAFSRAIYKGVPDGTGALPDERSCATATEAVYLAWLRIRKGEFRAAARLAVRGVRLGLSEKSWSSFGQAVEMCANTFCSIGQRKRAARVIEFARAAAESSGRAAGSPDLWVAKAVLACAEGRVSRGISALHEFFRLAVLQRLPADVCAATSCLESTFLRFAGKPEEVLACLAKIEPEMAPEQLPWLETPRVMAHIDLGREGDAIRCAGFGIDGFRAAHDESGAAFLRALRVAARADGGDRAGWLAESVGLPEKVEGDLVAERLCVWMKGEAALARGDRAEGLRLMSRLIGFAHEHRLFGCEVAARAAVSCALAGDLPTAHALVAELEPLPDSPVIEVWAAVARARIEERGITGLRHLQAVCGILPAAGVPARRAWYDAAMAAGTELGRVDDVASWKRLRDRESGTARTEDQVEARSLAAQARYIRDVVRDINAERKVARLLDKVLDAAISISGAERGCLVLVEEGRAEVRAVRPAGGALGSAGGDFSRTISDQVLLSGEPLLSGNAMSDGRLAGSASIPRLQVHSVLCMPFRLMGRMLGTVYLDHRKKADAFDPAVVDAIQTLADLAAVAIENAQLFEENERQRVKLQERAETLERRLEEVEKQDRGDVEAGLKWRYPAIVGRGPAMMEMLRSVERAADHSLPVLIHGETGTGKELVARAIHAHGAHKRGPFVAENCAAISPMLMESELFGHVKGSFSGATSDHEGLFRAANGGVLLLDEIGELDLTLQAKLLRVIEAGEVRPVGSDRTYKVKVRVVAATHRNLEDLVAKGKFRADLYYRLANFRIEVPPLRERIEDIPALVQRFLGRISESLEIEPGAMRMLMAFAWPGNVRQLEHSLSVMASGGARKIGLEDVQGVLGKNLPAETNPEENLQKAIERFRLVRVQAAIVACEGQLGPAARRLGMTYQGLRKIAVKHKLLALKKLAVKLNRSSLGRAKRRAAR
ncbi:MAG: sigma 54-interacting transcriptional regulator [Planctomycetes bacterium]|nr:sigma 54-interacting transcriptional regulator [Planctomycetota bacterium]